MEKRKFMSNMSTTIFSQIFIMLISVILSFLLPKFLSVNNYSLWQVFVFYSSYTGVFLLGINDGFIIKNAGKEYKELKATLKRLKKGRKYIPFFFDIYVLIKGDSNLYNRLSAKRKLER